MMSKKIVLRFEPSRGRKGVLLDQLYRSFLSLQKALWAIGEHSLTGEIRAKGRFPDFVLENFTLEIVGIEKGSLVVEAEIPVYQPSLFPQAKPEDALEKLKSGIKSIVRKEKEELIHIFPDKQLRRKVLYSLQDFFPERGVKKIDMDGLEIDKRVKDNIKELLITETTEEEEEIIGPIVELKIVGKKYFGILWKDRIEKLPLPDEIIDLVISYIAKLVKVTVILEKEPDTRREVPKEVVEIVPIDKNSFELSKIEYKGQEIKFTEPLQINISYEEDMWILFNKSLNIFAYGETFNKALESFKEDFIYLLEEIGKEDDENLDKKAKEMKERIITLLEKKDGGKENFRNN